MVCTFFGHADCCGLDSNVLQSAIEELIQNGADTFYVGHQGNFDRTVFSCLMRLKNIYPNISFAVVLAYLPIQKTERDPYRGYSIYPDGIENGLRRFAIERRNKWLIDHADYCLCYVMHTWGGAYKFAKKAKKEGLKTFNLGDVEL